MGALRRAGVWLGLIEDDEDRGYDHRGYDDDFEDEVEEAPAPVRPRTTAERLAEAREAGRAERTSVRPITRPSAPTATTNYPTRDNLALAPQVQLRERALVTEDEERRYQITTLHPTTYNEARTIGEHFRDGVPVIMNLTEMAEADAKRLVDFAAGLAFGLRGTMERVTNRVFLLSPANVQVTAEDKARIAEGGFFNQS
jgi:cell division inhibitor SepF